MANAAAPRLTCDEAGAGQEGARRHPWDFSGTLRLQPGSTGRRPGALPSGPGYAKIASMAAVPRALARGRKWEYFRSVKGSEWPTQRARETTSTDLDEEPVAVRHRCPYRRGLFRKASDHPATSGAGGHLPPKAGGAS